MCTVVAVSGRDPRHPLIVVANRDEFYARPSEGPQVLASAPRTIGGKDLESGGTWMGVSERGFFVALTNQRTWGPPAPQLRSRGHVVNDALRADSLAQVREYVRSLDAREFNSFNLIFGQPGEIWVAYARSEEREIELERADEDMVVLANDRLYSREFPKTARALTCVEAALEAGADELTVARALADHDRPPLTRLPTPPAGARFPPELVGELQALCIHTPLYGTVSSTTLMWNEAGELSRYIYSDGPPCTHAPRDMSFLLHPGEGD